MKGTLVDAGPLIALFDSNDEHHSHTRRFLEGFHSRLFTTWPVLAEAVSMLSFSTFSHRYPDNRFRLFRLPDLCRKGAAQRPEK